MYRTIQQLRNSNLCTCIFLYDSLPESQCNKNSLTFSNYFSKSQTSSKMLGLVEIVVEGKGQKFSKANYVQQSFAIPS